MSCPGPLVSTHFSSLGILSCARTTCSRLCLKLPVRVCFSLPVPSYGLAQLGLRPGTATIV